MGSENEKLFDTEDFTGDSTEVRDNMVTKLRHIQQELKAPKGQYNDYGKYKYRSCEDILEAVKPLLEKYELTIKLIDEVVQIGERYYIKATVRLLDDKYNYIENTAYAREDETKKGMDGSQITGTASSYARKYALNGLFAIDDTKDADTNEHAKQTGKEETEKKSKPASEKQIALCKSIAEKMGEELDENWLANLTMSTASDFISKYKGA